LPIGDAVLAPKAAAQVDTAQAGALKILAFIGVGRE